nr:UvrD-helicase domain-containing protein [Geodermatophilaceae bacterium]
ATTHSFCQRMLDGLGVAGEREAGVSLVEEADDVVIEVVDDLFLQEYAGHDSTTPKLSPKSAREVAREAVRDRQARLEPQGAGDTGAGQRVAIATAARVEVERRKRQRGVRDFDDLLVLLRDVLADPERGAAAAERIRERYRVVLVDEFQDTDPVQWEVLRRAFHATTTLILIGDPKQAVYAFRGAEVRSYLDAVRLADTHQTLSVNWRSDPGLLQALDQLYGGAALGHPDIVVHPVESNHDQSRLPGQVPFRLRQVLREPPLSNNGYPYVPALRERVAGDLAADVVRLLDSGTELDGRPVEPGDLAVLARTAKQITYVCAALDRAGLPWVLGTSTSVFETPSATDWLRVLQAMEQPQRAGRVRLAALTSLLGWTAADLANATDEQIAEVGVWLREWAALFAAAGFAAVFERLATQTRLEERLLHLSSGERTLTDLRHLAQTLNRAAVDDALGLTALTVWLDQRLTVPSLANTADRSRRLESDAAAIQVVTVHGSKGLEFPIVYVPFAWDGAKRPDLTTLLLHDADGARVRDIGGPGGPGYNRRKAIHDAEEAGEELRLLYVALTRAQSQVVAWWAPGAQTSGAPLQRLLMGRSSGEPEPSARAAAPQDDIATARLTAWATGPNVVHEIVGPAVALRWAPVKPEPATLTAARFDRSLDTEWRRTSYSSLTASVHSSPGVGSEAEQPGKTDEPYELPAVDVAAGGPLSTMNELPSGAAFGTLVHKVLETVDTSALSLPDELMRRCREAVAGQLADVDPVALADALLPVLRTPLGPGTLADVAPGDRLAELTFEFPLAGGDAPFGADVTLRRVALLLREMLPASDVLAPYADLLASIEAPALRGYLSGSIDMVLRLDGPRYVVVDYKTNRLARGDLTALHYTRAAMAAEMLRAHYPLQALLYCVALHRYLRWRQPAYDPAVHLGGVQYLFVRGMVGPATPAGCGVFDWDPPAALVVA